MVASETPQAAVTLPPEQFVTTTDMRRAPLRDAPEPLSLHLIQP